MRASSASASPKPVLCVFAGLAVLLVSYNLFGRPDSANASPEPPGAAYRPTGLDAEDGPTVNRRVVDAVAMDLPKAAAQPPIVSETVAAAAPVAAGTAAATGSTTMDQGMSFEDVSAVRARLTGVPATKAQGSLSSQCQLTVDAERRGLLTNLPPLQLSALGAGDCVSLPPALCAAVRGALGGVSDAAAGAPRLLVTTYSGGAAQAERLRLFADNAAALQARPYSTHLHAQHHQHHLHHLHHHHLHHPPPTTHHPPPSTHHPPPSTQHPPPKFMQSRRRGST